jgi:serine/threonine protein kinase
MHVRLAKGMDRSLCAALTALDIARGLRLLHLSNIVHGDLKPGNILFASDEAVRSSWRDLHDIEGFKYGDPAIVECKQIVLETIAC